MRPLKLELTNFRVFQGTHTFDFAGGMPGLYFVTGENRLRPALGANGIGKSSLFDAILWALTGASARGLQATNLVNWTEGSGCAVKLRFLLRDKKYTIYRSWHPNKLTLRTDGVTNVITQEEIDRLVGIDADLLRHGLLVTQVDNRTFFDLSPAEKQTVFTKLMRLADWTDRAARAQDTAQQSTASINVLEARLEVSEASEAAANVSYREQREARRVFDETHRARVMTLAQQVERAERQIAKVQLQLDKLRAERATMKEQVHLAKVNALKKRKVVDDIEEQVRKAEKDAATARARCDQTKEAWHRLDKLEDTCHVCKQQISEHHRARCVRDARKIWTGENKVLAVLEAALQKIRRRRDEAEGFARKAAAEHEHAAAFPAVLVERRQSLRDRRDELRNALIAAQAALDDARKEENTHAALARSAKSMRDGLRSQIADTRREISELTRKQVACTSWVSGFKQIRLAQINAALQELTVEVNDALAALGFPGAAVDFAVERETKSGTLSHGFQTLITPPGLDKPVPWAVWSGGETQRLRLAGLSGLMALIHNRTPFTPEFEIWDEPTQLLSQRGVDALLAFLAARAARLGRQIWLIDHRALPAASFQGTVRLVLDGSGVHLDA